MAVHFLPADSRLRVDGQTALDEVPGLVGDVDLVEVGRILLDVLVDLLVTEALERILSVDELVENDADRPDIRLSAVRLLLVHLWRHGQPSSKDGGGHSFLFDLFGEAQIGDLADILVQEYVGRLEVPMHGVDLVQSLEAIDDLFEEGGGLIFCEPALVLEVLLQFPPVAQLHDDDDALLAHEVVDIAHHVLVLALLQHPDFGLHELHQLGRALEELLGRCLGRSRFLRLLVEDLVDAAVVALPDDLEKGVVLDLEPQ